jgi:hypothetical protein
VTNHWSRTSCWARRCYGLVFVAAPQKGDARLGFVVEEDATRRHDSTWLRTGGGRRARGLTGRHECGRSTRTEVKYWASLQKSAKKGGQ